MNLTKFLKGKEGIELYFPIFGKCKLYRVDNNSPYPIDVIDNNKLYHQFTKKGYYLYNVNLNPKCLLFPSKEQRDWNKFIAPWYKKKEEFDPKTLQQYDKVLVRDSIDDTWGCSLFSHIIKHESFPYRCVGNAFEYCIPYNDDTKHLVGTTDEAPEYYRYWED